VKAAQSMTVSSSSEKVGRKSAEIWDKMWMVIGRRVRCWKLEDRLMPFRIRRELEHGGGARGLLCSM